MYETQLKEPVGKLSLPRVTGYRILIAMPQLKEKTEGGIIKPDQLLTREETASIVGNVVALGPDAYKDSERFPSGAWCEKGDWVTFRSYSGTRFKIKGMEFRIINDDSVESVVADPREIERA
jgi:co-chaperonin GroES (HSP10)